VTGPRSKAAVITQLKKHNAVHCAREKFPEGGCSRGAGHDSCVHPTEPKSSIGRTMHNHNLALTHHDCGRMPFLTSLDPEHSTARRKRGYERWDSGSRSGAVLLRSNAVLNGGCKRPIVSQIYDSPALWAGPTGSSFPFLNLAPVLDPFQVTRCSRRRLFW
jgi:hypothetical protein